MRVLQVSGRKIGGMSGLEPGTSWLLDTGGQHKRSPYPTESAWRLNLKARQQLLGKTEREKVTSPRPGVGLGGATEVPKAAFRSDVRRFPNGASETFRERSDGSG
ncbi:hypothetical protein Bbelb_086460 [Branchiostoma belcheri]|nr:hypothetical protein Bbelb_086460 [Branchiostoma belcheri]